MTVQGDWQPEYAGVVGAFAEAIASGPPGGGALAVQVRDRLVIDVWGGLARPRQAQWWTSDTLAATFSCTKGLLATCALRAAEHGTLDPDAPVESYWPDFAAAGKAGITPRMVLSHRAGLAALDVDLDLEQVLDGTAPIAALERQRPLWPPGTGHAYHAMTYGWLVAEILRRATGRPLADHFADLTACLGNDTWLGLPEAAETRLAEAAWDPARSDLRFPADHPDTPWRQRVITRSITLGGAFPPELLGPGSGLNDPAILARAIPAVGVVSTARSLATLWARTIGGIAGQPPLLGPAAVADAARCRSEGPSILGIPSSARWASGHMVSSPIAPMLTEQSFGHDGAGGQLCFADPVHEVGFAFLTNVLRNRGDNRARRLVEALRGCLRSTSRPNA